MERERLLQSNISNDLKIIVKEQISIKSEWRMTGIFAGIGLAIIFGMFYDNLWFLSVLFLCVATYHAVRYATEYREYSSKHKAVMKAINRADISVSLVRFSHISEEIIYEPHRHGVLRNGRMHRTKTVKYFCFDSGLRWRVPPVSTHYVWSKDYYISTQGLDNISVPGNEFYFISLQGYPDISYIYPCKQFVFEGIKK